jgi:amidase
LEPRSRPNVVIGRTVERTRLRGTRPWTRYRRAIDAFFSEFDLLLTPTLAAPPEVAGGWSRRGWVDNFRHLTWAGFTPAWNVAGNPAAAVPVDVGDNDVPPSVQLVADHGGEGLLLSVCQQIEQLRAWRRHPPNSRP